MAFNYPYQFQQPQQPQNGLLWVQGEAGAKSWVVPPSSTVLLMDSEESKFYLKSADASGMPSLRTFEYTEKSPQRAPIDAKLEEYATRAEMDEIRAKFEEITHRLEELTPEKKPARAKKEAENE